jgi:hypothetical protein
MLCLQMNCKKGGGECDSYPKRPGYFVYDYEIENLDYKGYEKINFLHFANGILKDTFNFIGLGGMRKDSIREVEYQEDVGCQQLRFIDQTFVLKYSDNLDTLKITLYGDNTYEKITSRTSINFEFKNKKFTDLLAYLSNINSPNYFDSISLYGVSYFNVNKIQKDKDSSNYLIYGYKNGINLIKIDNEIFQSY